MNKNNYKNILLALLFMLIALPAAMMAQTNTERYMVVTENDGTVTVFDFDEIESVTWDVPEPLPGSVGTGKATINGNEVDVKWVQLWADGPRFAKYNVGVTNGQAESYGGHYCWGSSIDKDPNQACKESNDALTGNDDTATNLWGSNWRMPTDAEFVALYANCDVEQTTVNNVYGRKFTGKGDYASNSVFLPAAGYCKSDNVYMQGDYGSYWTSTPHGVDAYYLELAKFNGTAVDGMVFDGRFYGFSVRAIYDPQPEPTTGTAKATIGDDEIDVPWVQLWEDGPKFAKYNVGVTDGKAESVGGSYCWGGSIDKDPNKVYNTGSTTLTGTDDTATNLWGSNWRMPTHIELDALLHNCDFEWTTVNGVNGFKFTGKDNYTNNSVFFPNVDYLGYWSATPFEYNYSFFLYLDDSDWQEVLMELRNTLFFVRAVLAE